eukprot:TRINITY_DN2145_c0_g2_i1.p1 TRINITY_DN2145_c0_g2~~TRINITY_DN2145_c0_g2_i1.p1  ORF type:complete len:320 (+),score=78.40 TRINITY_DN2145_c0_g2_i1:93-1052(+)
MCIRDRNNDENRGALSTEHRPEMTVECESEDWTPSMEPGTARGTKPVDRFAHMRSATPRCSGGATEVGTPRSQSRISTPRASIPEELCIPRTGRGVSFNQIKAMFQERMKALVMKDTHRLKEVFRQYDKRGIGSLTLEQFRAIMLDFGVDMIPEEAERFMRRYTRQRDEIPFTDFFQRLLGFPPDYFSAKLKSNANEAPDKAMATRKPYDKLPADTPDEKLTRLFVSRVRSRLYDVNSALVNVLKKGRGDRYFGLKELNDIIVVNGSTPTKRELQELMDHFDLRGDGRIHYHEFVYELLDLPIPREIATTIPNHKSCYR